MSANNKKQECIYVGDDVRHVWDHVREKAKKTGEGIGMLLLGSYAEKNKIKIEKKIKEARDAN